MFLFTLKGCFLPPAYNEIMTSRPVYIPKKKKPFYQTKMTEFEWNPGISPTQKKKNSAALHEAYLNKHPDAHILEVSTKSEEKAGQSLSPFNLTKTIPSLKKAFPVENIYQASKVFTKGGPYVDILGTTPLQAKRDPRLENSGSLAHYQLENEKYPADPDILFYNWLYIQALMENPGLRKEIPKYNAFTDIEFNPETGRNNQARACAIYLSLLENGLLDQARTFEGFKNLFLETDITQIKEQYREAAPEQVINDFNKTVKRHVFSVGQWLEHPGIGKGEVYRKTRDGYLINFKVSGPRTIAKDFVETQCKPLYLPPK